MNLKTSLPLKQPLNWPLNWKEIEILIQTLKPLVEGALCERLFIPLRSYFKLGFLKEEWALNLRKGQSVSTLLFNTRSKKPYFLGFEGKPLKSATQSTLSPFLQLLKKHIEGKKIISIDSITKERAFWITFLDEEILAIHLTPSKPEAFLLKLSHKKITCLTSSQSKKTEKIFYKKGDGKGAPDEPPVQNSALLKHPKDLFLILESQLQMEAHLERKTNLDRILKKRLEFCDKRKNQAWFALENAKKEPDYQMYGDTIKSSLPHLPPIDPKTKTRSFKDLKNNKIILIPGESHRTATEEMNHQYVLSKRKIKRIEEAQKRYDSFLKMEEGLKKLKIDSPNWEELIRLEKLLCPQTTEPNKKNKLHQFTGRQALSKEGLVILVGRSKDENLELTTKIAKGNDLWLHVKGRPSAHAVIIIPPGKTASLETLLDACTLVVFHSGGEKWGKTEVDYTYKKHVKRIPKSDEVQYTQNKTLIIDLSTSEGQIRLHRLKNEGELI